MNYHHRYNADGSCEVICTSCFLTVGTTAQRLSAREIEARHTCGAVAGNKALVRTLPEDNSFAGRRISHLSVVGIDRYLNFAWGPSKLQISLSVFGTVLFCYALPTAIEFVVAEGGSPWFASVLLGNVAGCACLFAIFKMRKTGPLLYLLLASCGNYLYATRIVSPHLLPWFTDSVPTLLVTASMIARRRSSADDIASPPVEDGRSS